MAEATNKPKQALKPKDLEIAAHDSSKLFPKLCTKVLLEVSQDGANVITFLYETGGSAYVIDRVVISDKLKANLVELLQNGIENVAR